MEEVARSEAFPAISAFVATNGGQACPAAPKGNGVPSAVPSPAFVGPTFYRCTLAFLLGFRGCNSGSRVAKTVPPAVQCTRQPGHREGRNIAPLRNCEPWKLAMVDTLLSFGAFACMAWPSGLAGTR